MDTAAQKSCDNLKGKCRLCAETAIRKNYFFSDAGKSLELKRIIFKLCEIVVLETDELPKFCCRSCYEKLIRLNKNVEAFALKCKTAQKAFEREQITKKRYRSVNSPTSTEKPRKQPCTMVTASFRKSLSFDQNQQSDNAALQEKEVTDQSTFSPYLF